MGCEEQGRYVPSTPGQVEGPGGVAGLAEQPPQAQCWPGCWTVQLWIMGQSSVKHWTPTKQWRPSAPKLPCPRPVSRVPRPRRVVVHHRPASPHTPHSPHLQLHASATLTRAPYHRRRKTAYLVILAARASDCPRVCTVYKQPQPPSLPRQARAPQSSHLQSNL